MTSATRHGIAALGVVLLLATGAAALDITACDTEVPAGDVAVITTDLDCGPNTVPDSYGIELESGATLDLQGHTITGAQWAVYCPGPRTCTVTSTSGTGTLTGAEAGIWTPESKVVVSNVHFADNEYGISNNPKTTLTDVSFAGNGFALTTRSLFATNVSITGSCDAAYCFDLGRGRIDGLVTTTVGAANVIQVTRSVDVRNASMSGGAGQIGIVARRIRIRDSVVTGHDVDLASRGLRGSNVSCGKSRRFGQGGFGIGSWEICAND